MPSPTPNPNPTPSTKFDTSNMQSTDANAKPASCNLLNLPAELRNRIYEFASEDTAETFVVDLLHPASSSDNAALNLGKTCKQLKQEYTSHFYGQKVVRVLAPAFDEGVDAIKLERALDHFVKQYITWNKPPRVEIYIGDVEAYHYREQWKAVEGPIRRLAKTTTKVDLSFDLMLASQQRVRIEIGGPESVAAQLDKAYFSQRRRTLLLGRQVSRDQGAWDFLGFEEHILRSLFPLWWMRHRSGSKRLSQTVGPPFEKWFKLDESELQRLLNTSSSQQST